MQRYFIRLKKQEESGIFARRFIVLKYISFSELLDYKSYANYISGVLLTRFKNEAFDE